MRQRMRKLLMVVGLVFAGALALTGCREPGPAEEAGREIDEAVEDARDAMDELGDETEDALDELEDEID